MVLEPPRLIVPGHETTTIGAYLRSPLDEPGRVRRNGAIMIHTIMTKIGAVPDKKNSGPTPGEMKELAARVTPQTERLDGW